MDWPALLESRLEVDRQLAAALAGPFAPLIRYQVDRLGREIEQVRLPRYFQGDWAGARVCFLGPHVVEEPGERAPTLADSVATYWERCGKLRDDALPYSHYGAIMAGEPWVATELIHWPSDKPTALQVLKGPEGRTAVSAGLEMTWSMLRASPAEVLVLTGNDALAWILPELGWRGGKLPGVTQLHGQRLGKLALPGAPGREVAVVASFHWSPEMPMFVRKVAGLGGLPVREAISRARQMIRDAVSERPN